MTSPCVQSVSICKTCTICPRRMMNQDLGFICNTVIVHSASRCQIGNLLFYRESSKTCKQDSNPDQNNKMGSAPLHWQCDPIDILPSKHGK
uniref:Uncharacterized protein n=1 Tax=Rhizophora mucronata TaxID=61149 RepID=A0A2P2K1H5_RHIMU